eukprot:283405_1
MQESACDKLVPKISTTTLLTYGYVNQTYKKNVPMPIIELMRKYYDQYIHFVFGIKELKSIIKTKNGTQLTCKLYEQQNIQFEIGIYPNGKTSKMLEYFQLSISIKNFPSNVVFIKFFHETTWTKTNFAVKSLCKAQKSSRNRYYVLCKLSALKRSKYVCLSSLINVQCIKYKYDCNLIDYHLPMTMSKYYTFEWEITQLLIENCANNSMLYSNSFDNGNWCLAVNNECELYICLLLFPNKKMDVKFRIVANIDGQKGKAELIRKKFYDASAKKVFLCNVSEYEYSKSLKLMLTLELMDIYDANDRIIKESEFDKHGIIINNPNDDCITYKRGNMSI